MIFKFLRNIGIQYKLRTRPLVSIRVVQTRRKLSLVRRNLKPTAFRRWVVHKALVMERSLEDLRMKGEHLHDHIKKIDEEWQALSTSKIHEIETHRIAI